MRYERDQSEFDRAIAFIDATFALALTLLVTTLEIDDQPTSFTSLDALGDAVGPQFIAFLIAFVVTAGYWLMNHRMVASFVAIDTPTIIANIGVVCGVVLLPFTTAAVGDPDVADLPLPTVLMAVNIALVSTLHTVVWVIAGRNRLLDHEPSRSEWRQRVFSGLVPATVFAASVPLAYIASPDLARTCWLLLAVINPAVGAAMARAQNRSEER